MKYFLLALFLVIPSQTFAMTSVIFPLAGPILSAATRFYNFNEGGGAVSATSDNGARGLIAIPGTVSNLTVNLSAAPGAGTSYIFTLMVNGVATALTCTIANLATSCADTTDAPAVAAGNGVSWRASVTGVPGTPAVMLSASMTGTNTGESFISGGMPGTPSVNNLNYYTMPGANTINGIGSDVTVSDVMPTAGTIDQFYIESGNSPSTANVWSLMKNGATTTITCSINGVASCSDLTHSIAYVQGDTISMALQTGTTGATAPRWSMRFKPTVDGESVVFSHGAAVTSGRFQRLQGNSGNNATEALMNAIVPTSLTFEKASFEVDAAPGGVTTRTLVARKNNTTTGTNAATITSAATSGFDNIHTDSYVANDLINWQTNNSGSPAGITLDRLAGVIFIAPPVTASGVSQTIINGATVTLNGGIWLLL